LACSNKIKVVFEYLESNFKPEDHKVHAAFKAVVDIVQNKISKWETIGNKLEKVGNHLKVSKNKNIFLLIN
jgi:hypothetical protein